MTMSYTEEIKHAVDCGLFCNWNGRD